MRERQTEKEDKDVCTMFAGPSSVTPWVEETLRASSPWHFLLTACHKGPWEAKATWETAWPLHPLLAKPTALPSLGCCVHTTGTDEEAAVSGWFLLPFFSLHKALEWFFFHGHMKHTFVCFEGDKCFMWDLAALKCQTPAGLWVSQNNRWHLMSL